VSLTVSPVEDDGGTIVAVSIVARDITERRRAEEHQRMLLAELSHRVKNTLAVVQAIAVQTLSQYGSLEEFSAAFVDRLQSLANAHTLLTRSNWAGAQLRELVAEELAPYSGHDGRNVTVTGEDVLLKPSAALSLAMVLHELATNASKYGALSAPAGRIEVRWHRREGDGDGRRLVLQWTESGGPGIGEPPRPGFGLRFIERCVVYELYGAVDMAFAPTGATCTISLPLRDNVVTKRPPDR
jgi:two-component sensor histidine kinase